MNYATRRLEIDQQYTHINPDGIDPVDYTFSLIMNDQQSLAERLASVGDRAARLRADPTYNNIPKEQKVPMEVLIRIGALRFTLTRVLGIPSLPPLGDVQHPIPALEAASTVYWLRDQAHEPGLPDPIILPPVKPAHKGLALRLMDYLPSHPHPSLKEILSVTTDGPQPDQLRRMTEAREYRAFPAGVKKWTMVLVWSLIPDAPLVLGSTTRVIPESIPGAQYPKHEAVAMVAAQLEALSPFPQDKRDIIRALALRTPYLLIRLVANTPMFHTADNPPSEQVRPEQSTRIPHPL